MGKLDKATSKEQKEVMDAVTHVFKSSEGLPKEQRFSAAEKKVMDQYQTLVQKRSLIGGIIGGVLGAGAWKLLAGRTRPYGAAMAASVGFLCGATQSLTQSTVLDFTTDLLSIDDEEAIFGVKVKEKLKEIAPESPFLRLGELENQFPKLPTPVESPQISKFEKAWNEIENKSHEELTTARKSEKKGLELFDDPLPENTHPSTTNVFDFSGTRNASEKSMAEEAAFNPEDPWGDELPPPPPAKKTTWADIRARSR